MTTRNPKAAVDPACLKALEQLKRITTIDEFTYTSWLRGNKQSLQERFMFSAEFDDQAGAWCRFEYVRALGRIP